MQITATWEPVDEERLRKIIREEIKDALAELIVANLAEAKKTKKKEPKPDKLEERAQAEIAKAAEESKVEITDDDLPSNMQAELVKDPNTVLPVDGHLYTGQSGVTQMPGSKLPSPDQDRPIEQADKTELAPRIRALNLGQGVLREWVLRNTGLDDPWALGYYRFKLMLSLFEQAKSGGNEAIAKFIAGV